jgi:hypothetical protein
MDYNKLLEEARGDPSLFSTIDVDELLSKVENANHLENKTIRTIARENHDVIAELNISEELLQKFCDKLTGYRHVDKICDLLLGRIVILIKRQNPTKLIGYSSVVRIDILDNGVYFLLLTCNRKFLRFKFDECVVFQKLTTEEQLVLMSCEYAQNG